MGRIPKVEKERALLETRMQSQASGSMDLDTDDQSTSDVWLTSKERDHTDHPVSSFNKEKMCITNPSTLFYFEKNKNQFSQDSADYSGLKQNNSMYSWMINSETNISGQIDKQPVQAASKNIDPALNLTSYTTYRKVSQQRHNTLSSLNNKSTARSHSQDHIIHQPLSCTQFTNPVVQHTHMPSHALLPSNSTSNHLPTTNQSLQNSLTYPLEPSLLLKYPVKTEPITQSFQHTLDRETVSCDNPFAQSTTSTISNCHPRTSQVMDSFEQFQNLTPTWPEDQNVFVPVQIKNEIHPDQNNIYKIQEKKIKLNVSNVPVTPLTKEMCKRTSYSPDVIKVLLDQVGGEKIRAMKHQIMSTVAQYVGREEYEAAKQLLKPYTDIPEKIMDNHVCTVKQTGNEAHFLFPPSLANKSGLVKNSLRTLHLPLTSQHNSSSTDQYLVPDVSNSSLEFEAETYFNHHVLDQTHSLGFSLSINSHSEIGSICQENSKHFDLTSDDLNNLESLVTNTSTETDQPLTQENNATLDFKTSKKVCIVLCILDD